MKNHLIDIAEGLIFGISLVIVLRLLNIEVTAFQIGVLASFSVLAVSLLNSIGMHLKGQGVAKINEPAAAVFAVKKTWTFRHGENTIEIKNAATLCELIVNGHVQDSIKGIFAMSLKLSGQLPNGDEVKASYAHTRNRWIVRVGDVELKEVSA